ncbi:MAG: hypothetical protein AAGD14_02835 [Planctomycetota bacterium]
MSRPRKQRRVVRTGGVLKIVRGKYTELPPVAVAAGVVAALLTIVLVTYAAYWIFTYERTTIYNRHPYAGSIVTGVLAGGLVGLAIRLLGGSGPGAAKLSVVLALGATVAGLFVGLLAWTDGAEEARVAFGKYLDRVVFVIVGAGLSALGLIPDAFSNRSPGDPD